MTDLYFCAGGTRRFAGIAIDAGFIYGARLPVKVYYPIRFSDQEYRRPERMAAYVESVKEHRPDLATVLDYDHTTDLETVLGWAEAIAPYVGEIIVIPKIPGTIAQIPARIAGRPIRLGYSVPTSNGATDCTIQEFGARPVHLLGGSPERQLGLAARLNVLSMDTNYHQKQAMRAQVWHANPWKGKAKNKRWPTLRELGLYADHDAPYIAFQMSCANIMSAWKKGNYIVKTPLF